MSEIRFSVLDQLDQLEEIVLEGSRIPFSGGRLVNEQDAVELLDAVREAMLPFLDSEFGNPSSIHGVGRRRGRPPLRPSARTCRVAAGVAWSAGGGRATCRWRCERSCDTEPTDRRPGGHGHARARGQRQLEQGLQRRAHDAVGVEVQSRERAAFLRDIGSFFLAVPSIRKDQIGMQTAYHFGCHAQAHALEFKLILLYLLFEKEADPWNISAVVCLVE